MALEIHVDLDVVARSPGATALFHRCFDHIAGHTRQRVRQCTRHSACHSARLSFYYFHDAGITAVGLSRIELLGIRLGTSLGSLRFGATATRWIVVCRG